MDININLNIRGSFCSFALILLKRQRCSGWDGEFNIRPGEEFFGVSFDELVERGVGPLDI